MYHYSLTYLFLFRYLEFSGFNDLSCSVKKFVDVNAAVEVCKINGSMIYKIILLMHFSSNKTIDLDRIAFVRSFLEIECDK